MSDTSLCSKCQAPILWACTVNGKPQPLDLEPDPAGNIWLIPQFAETDRGWLQECRVIPKAEREASSLLPEQSPRYMPHHATCPDAESFRHPKRRAS